MIHVTWLRWRVGGPPPRDHGQVLLSFICCLNISCTPSPLISKRSTSASKSHLPDYSPGHKGIWQQGGRAFPSAVFTALASLEGTCSEGSVAPVLFPMEMGLETSTLPLGSPVFF